MQSSHAFLCAGGMKHGSPLLEFRSLIEDGGLTDTPIQIAAELIALALSKLLEEETLNGEMLAAALSESFLILEPLCDKLNGEHEAKCASGGYGAKCTSNNARSHKLRAAKYMERTSKISDAWSLLLSSFLTKLPTEAAARAEKLLDANLFSNLVQFFDRYLVPIELSSPLVTHVSKLTEDPNSKSCRDVLLTIFNAIERDPSCWLTAIDSKNTSVSDELVQMQNKLLQEASSMSARDIDSHSTKDDIIVNHRRAKLLSQCAQILFPSISVMVFVPFCTQSDTHASILPHSCIPTLQIQLSNDNHMAPNQKCSTLSGTLCQELYNLVRFVPVRPLINSEPHTISWIDASIACVHERSELLKAKFGDGFICHCCRCENERRADEQDYHSARQPNRALLELRILARDAIEDGRSAQAVRILRNRVDNDCTDGDTWMLLGISLLNCGHWEEAHTVWQQGASLNPSHEILQKQVQKDEAYYSSVTTSATSVSSNAADLKLFTPSSALIVCTAEPILSPGSCSNLIKAAEKYAAASGGWTTTRHHAVPTTDLPVHMIPEALKSFNEAMQMRIVPCLSKHFEVDSTRIRVHDAFVVKYRAGSQTHLPFHVDESIYSLTLALNDGFVGGGTHFAELGETIQPGVGQAVIFHGRTLHGGEPVVAGERYIIAAFLYLVGSEEKMKRARVALNGESFSFCF